jgi:hypothetical protein
MVMEEMPVARETHLLIRGMYDKPGDVVTPMLPAVLAQSPTAYRQIALDSRAGSWIPRIHLWRG